MQPASPSNSTNQPSDRPLRAPVDEPSEVSPLEISDELLCLFSASIDEVDDTYTVEIPRREVETGDVQPGETYRIAVIAKRSADTGEAFDEETQPEPPVEPGDTRYVEIEDIGKQGDGIARVERGYVIIVPGADIGDRVKIEVTDVKPNFAVGEIVEETF